MQMIDAQPQVHVIANARTSSLQHAQRSQRHEEFRYVDSTDSSAMASLSEAAKKSRAKSCTSCRQVKLRCDVREKYPEPCSRCIARKQECAMDPHFKRVKTRTLSRHPARSNPGHERESLNSLFGTGSAIQHRSQSANTLEGSEAQVEHIQLSSSEVRVEPSLMQERWLNLGSSPVNQDTFRSWTLGPFQIEQSVILDLYKQFEEYYHVHLPILEPVQSLQKLYEDSPTLFWAITFTTSRHHPRHSNLYTKLREPFQVLISNLLSSPVPALKDLQALLIVCQWPLEVARHSEDPSWMLIGFVVNAALHMGLDKFEDEVLFGQRRAKHSLVIHDPKYRRRTWMKAFQISTQLSTWQGLRPHISSASSLQKLTEFCQAEAAGEVVAMTEIQRQVARNTTSLDDLAIHGPQVSLVHHFTQEMDSIRRKFANVWSAATEINLQGAMIYLVSHCLLLADDQEHGAVKNSDTDHFVATIMQRGYEASLKLIKVINDLGAASAIDPACTKAEDGGAPLLAHPKQHFRLAFQACLFLLKYLDYNLTAPIGDQDAARNAVLTVYQIFKQFISREEFLRAARTLEVLARSVVPGDRRMKTMVKTRMGASLNYNAVWTAAKLRGRQHDPEFTVTVSASREPMVSDPFLNALDAEPAFPWGIWDDAAYDELALGLDDPLFSGFTAPMDLF